MGDEREDIDKIGQITTSTGLEITPGLRIHGSYRIEAIFKFHCSFPPASSL
jgi:hypothetical protein